VKELIQFGWNWRWLRTENNTQNRSLENIWGLMTGRNSDRKTLCETGIHCWCICMPLQTKQNGIAFSHRRERRAQRERFNCFSLMEQNRTNVHTTSSHSHTYWILKVYVKVFVKDFVSYFKMSPSTHDSCVTESTVRPISLRVFTMPHASALGHTSSH
jgi:hypothetical protein